MDGRRLSVAGASMGRPRRRRTGDAGRAGCGRLPWTKRFASSRGRPGIVHGRRSHPHQRCRLHGRSRAVRGTRPWRSATGASSAWAARLRPRALAGPRTRVVDLAGRLVLPGFIDAHMHPKHSTGELFEVYLGGCRSVAECLAAVERLAAAHPEYPAVRGWGWTPTTVREDEMTAAALDAVVPDRPVVLADDSVHTQWVNSVMLQMAGITKDTPDPDGGVDRTSVRRDSLRPAPRGVALAGARAARLRHGSAGRRFAALPAPHRGALRSHDRTRGGRAPRRARPRGLRAPAEAGGAQRPRSASR